MRWLRGVLSMANDFNWDDYESVPSSGDFNWNDYEENNGINKRAVPQRLGNLPFLNQWAESLEKHPGIKKILGATAENVAKPINQFVEGIGAPQIAGGFLQGIGDVGASVANIPLSIASYLSGKNLNVPHPSFRNVFPDDASSSILFGAGELGGGGLGAGGVFKALGAIPKVGEVGSAIGGILPNNIQNILSKISPDTFKAALTGAAIGEDLPGGRLASAAVGGVGSEVSKGLGKFKNFLSLDDEKIANSFLDKVENLQNKFSNRYNDLFDTAEKTNITKLGLPHSEVGRLKDNLTRVLKNQRKKETEAIRDFWSNPTLKNAHKAQSELGALERKFQSTEVKQGDLGTSQNKTWDAVKHARDTLQNAIESTFEKSGNERLTNKYKQLTADYAKELAPYLKSKTIRKYKANELLPQDFAKSLLREADFVKSKGLEHPELERLIKKHKFMKNAKMTAIGAAVPAAIGPIGYKLYKAASD